MNYVILQFIHLENLLAEASGDKVSGDKVSGADALRVHVLERSEATTSNVLTRKEITIGLCVRTITLDRRILSWYCQVDKFSFYLHEQPSNGHAPNGRSPDQERYETAWQRASIMQDELVARLRRDEYTVHTDGVIELRVSSLLRGTTDLVNIAAELPAAVGS